MRVLADFVAYISVLYQSYSVYLSRYFLMSRTGSSVPPKYHGFCK